MVSGSFEVKYKRFFYLAPSIIKLAFPKMNAYKITNFVFIIKTELHTVKLYTSNKRTKFPNNIFVFCCSMAEKQVPIAVDVTFFKRNFWHLYLSSVNISDICFQFEARVDMIGMVLKIILHFKICPNLTWHWSLSQIWKRAKPLNSTSQMAQKTFVLRHSCSIFIRWYIDLYIP